MEEKKRVVALLDMANGTLLATFDNEDEARKIAVTLNKHSESGTRYSVVTERGVAGVD